MKRTDIEMSDVFISWTSADVEIKNAVKTYLRGKNIKCTDSEEACQGNFKEWSEEAARSSSVFLLILTENSLQAKYVPLEVRSALKMKDAANRIIVLCPDLNTYRLERFGENGENLLRDKHISVITYGDVVTERLFEEAYNKTTKLLIGRFYDIYNKNCNDSSRYIELIPLYKEKQKLSDRQFSYDSFYIPRTITEIGANGEEAAKIDSPQELIDCGDILFLSGVGGSGKSQYLKQIRHAIKNDDTLMISLSCSKVAGNPKTLFDDMFEHFYEKCGSREFYSQENFRTLLAAKKLLLVFDGMDEIPTETLTRNFLGKVRDFYEPNSQNTTLLFTSRNEKDAEYITFNGKPVRKFRLANLTEEDIENFGANLFLLLGESQKGNDFYVRVKELSEEIKANPLLLSQLAIVYNDSGEIPKTIVGIFDAVSAITFKRDSFINSAVIPDDYRGMIDNISSLLTAFAAERYIRASQGKKFSAAQIFEKLLKSQFTFDFKARAKFLVEYIEDRAIYVDDGNGNGEFYHKMFSEYFTAVYYYERAFDSYGEIEDVDIITELFGHYSDPYWAKVLQLFLIKADSCVDVGTTKELYKLILSGGKIQEYTLLFDVCRDLYENKLEAQTTLVCDILQKSVDNVYPPYGPLFWYVPEYGLYEVVLLAAAYMRGNAKALALVRDVCYIYGQKNNVKDITDKVDGNELFNFASKDLTGVRRALCEIFYLGDTEYNGGKDIYPRCFNVADTLSIRDYSCGVPDRMHTPFNDELGLYSHTSYNLLDDEYIGLISCAYNIAEAEETLGEHRSLKISGLILSSTEETTLKYINFTRISVTVLYIPENITKVDDDCKRFFKPLLFDTVIDSDCIFNVFGDVVLPVAYSTKTFKNCKTVKSVIFLDGATEIGKDAFAGCSSLEKIEIPIGLTKIGESAFSNCVCLKEIELPESLEEMDNGVFYGCSSLTEIDIPNNIEKIGHLAFKNCHSLTKIVMPDSVKEIGVSAFKNCSSLTEIKLSNSVKVIGRDAFSDCSSLTEIIIPDSVKVIGWSAFENCSSLTEIKLSHSLKGIEESTFSNCSSLNEIIIPDSVKEIGEFAFENCSSLAKIVMPDSVKVIGGSVFSNCSSLTEIVIPDSVKEIWHFAFKNCYSLTEIELPNSLEEIGDGAFLCCESLIHIEIPKGIKRIGKFLFDGCNSLRRIILSEYFKSSINNLGLPKNIEVLWMQDNRGKANETFVIKEGFEKIDGGTLLGGRDFKRVEVPKSVKFIESYTFAECSSLTEIVIPDSVKEIGSYAFMRCSNLTEINLPKGLERIEKGMFTGCYSLLKIEIPNSVKKIGDIIEDKWERIEYSPKFGAVAFESISSESIGAGAFEGCRNLIELYLSDNLEEIGDFTFSNCSSLIEIEIPQSVKKIGSSVFSGCSSLEKLNIPDGIEKIEEGTFSECVKVTKFIIPNSVKEIGEFAFSNCSCLTEIKLPERLERIGNYTFENCDKLSNIKIPDSVKAIGSYAFKGCSNLTEINLPKGLEQIEEGVFSGCSGLIEIKIPDSIKSISGDISLVFQGSGAFSGCSSLKKIIIPNDVKEIGAGVFYGCSSLTEIDIPENIEEIGCFAFSNCISLIDIRIPKGIKRIGGNAFTGCSSLKSINISDSVKIIGAVDFKDCKQLTEIKIPDGVTELGNGAFENCVGLQEIAIPKSVISIGDNAFKGCTGLKSVTISLNFKNDIGRIFGDIDSAKIRFV